MGTNPSDPNDIRKFSLRGHVRLRPGMFIGCTDERALHNLAYEVIDDAVEEALAGHCDQIWITLSPNHQITIKDNGRGIPLDKNSDGKPLLELLMTSSGVDRRQGNYYIRGGFFGILLYAVNALSAELTVEVARDGYIWRQAYKEGIPQGSVEQVRELASGETTGKTITFTPDFSILEQNLFSFDTLAQRSREIAYTVPGITVTLRDFRVQPSVEQHYYFATGLDNLVEDLNQGKVVLHEPISGGDEWTITRKNKGQTTIGVNFAFQYTDTTTTIEQSFAKTVNTFAGGTHVSGFWSAITSVVNYYTNQAGIPPFTQEELAVGLTVTVSVNLPDPSFESQTKIKLINPEAYGVVTGIVYEKTREYLERNVDVRERVVQKCLVNRAFLGGK